MAICWRRIIILTNMPRYQTVCNKICITYSQISFSQLRASVVNFLYFSSIQCLMLLRVQVFDRLTDWLAVTGIKHIISRFMRKLLATTIAIEKLTEFYQSSNNELNHSSALNVCIRFHKICFNDHRKRQFSFYRTPTQFFIFVFFFWFSFKKYRNLII